MVRLNWPTSAEVISAIHISNQVIACVRKSPLESGSGREADPRTDRLEEGFGRKLAVE